MRKCRFLSGNIIPLLPYALTDDKRIKYFLMLGQVSLAGITKALKLNQSNV